MKEENYKSLEALERESYSLENKEKGKRAKLKSKLKEESGSITAVVTVTIMFFITILATAYAITATLRQSQLKSQLALKEQYEEDINNVNEIAQKLAYTGGKLDINSEEVQELIKQIKLSMYPVGSIYISASSTNPSEFIGGTWESYGQGRTLIGAGTGTDTNSESQTFAVNTAGGEYKHTLSVNEMPKHEHGEYLLAYGYEGWSEFTASWYGVMIDCTTSNYIGPNSTLKAAVVSTFANTGANGGSQPHNNLQPYIVTYMWKRIE